MKINKFKLVAVALVLLSVCHFPAYARGESNRGERICINEGNKLYNEGRYRAALLKYQEALKLNPSSEAGRYNLGLSQIRLGTNENDSTQAAIDMLKRGCEAMEQVGKTGSTNPKLAAKANYNLGNVSFKSEDYGKAADCYKRALRLNPEDAAAKRNLRIAQLKKQEQENQNKDNQDQNQNQNRDQDQDQDKQEQNKDNRDQNQERNQNQQDQNQDRQNDLNQQTADQILQAMENKENQTRARVGKGAQGEKSTGRNRSRKNW